MGCRQFVTQKQNKYIEYLENSFIARNSYLVTVLTRGNRHLSGGYYRYEACISSGTDATQPSGSWVCFGGEVSGYGMLRNQLRKGRKLRRANVTEQVF